MSEPVDDPRAAFVEACVGHGSLERAAAILAAHPEVASSDIHIAAILGDDAAVRRFLELDAGQATAKGGPRGWDALTYLCFSRYLRLDRARSDGFVRAARALLDAGASANTGFFDISHKPEPEWEPVLCGAAGVAHHAEMTRLLLERGANPNDEEVVYYTPESYDNAALKLLVQTGKLTDDSLALMLVRELVADGGQVLAEFAGNGNTNGVGHLLDLGVDVGAVFKEGDGYWDIAKDSTALHAAAWRARHATVKLLIERGAAVNVPDGKGRTPSGLAVRACVDSYWSDRRSPESVAALLRGGASVAGVVFPSSYAEVDELLRSHFN